MLVITLCTYVQQGYVFGRVGLCMYVCTVYVYYVDQERTVWGFTTRKSLVSVIYYSLVEFNGQKRGLLCQAIRSGKEIWLLMGRKRGPGKLYYGKPRLVYMQCSYATLTNTECQHITAAVQTYNITTGAVCSDSA